MSTYHDVHVTTEQVERTAIFDLPYGYELTCNRVSGWTLWGPPQKALDNIVGPFPAPAEPVKVAGEYDKAGLRIDIAGVVICDSLTRST